MSIVKPQIEKERKEVDIEEEIRPMKRQKVNFSLLESDIRELMLPFQHEFMPVNCPNCSGEKGAEDFRKGSFSFSLCPDCGTVFVNPRPPKELLDDFYSKSKAFHGFTESLIENEQGRVKHIFIPRAGVILDFLRKVGQIKGELLEVGCSIGTMLSIFKEQSDLNVFGVDPSPAALEVTRKRGLVVYPETIERYNPGEKRFDVVLSFETIEHLFWPVEFVKKVNEVMNEGGYFIFSTPNYHGYDIMTLGRHYKRISAPFHLNYFNVGSIDVILNLAGFKVVKKITPGILDLINVRKQIEAGDAPEVSEFTKYLLSSTSKETQDRFQRFLSHNCLSGHMLIFSRKVNSLR